MFPCPQNFNIALDSKYISAYFQILANMYNQYRTNMKSLINLMLGFDIRLKSNHHNTDNYEKEKFLFSSNLSVKKTSQICNFNFNDIRYIAKVQYVLPLIRCLQASSNSLLSTSHETVKRKRRGTK